MGRLLEGRVIECRGIKGLKGSDRIGGIKWDWELEGRVEERTWKGKPNTETL